MLKNFFLVICLLTTFSATANERRISLRENCPNGLLLIESETPIKSIINNSESDIYLLDAEVSLEKGEEHLFEDNCIFQAVISAPKAVSGDVVVYAKALNPAKGYRKSAYVDDETWEAVKPYLLPENHPIKTKLDRIFSKSRVTATKESMSQAGFEFAEGQGLHAVVIKHKDLKGYVVKAYSDYQMEINESEKWLARIKGAEVIKHAIQRHKLKRYFKVPKKWIYPLPDNTSPPDDPNYTRKNFILIAEDMGLLSMKSNHKKWRSVKSKSLLKKVYHLTEDYGLHDSLRVSNLAWTRSQKLAFVDTESFNVWPVNHHALMEFLPKKRRPYWKQLTSSARKTPD